MKKVDDERAENHFKRVIFALLTTNCKLKLRVQYYNFVECKNFKLKKKSKTLKPFSSFFSLKILE